MIIVLNHKSNLDKFEFMKYQEEFQKISSNNTIIMCPTNLNIPNFKLNNCLLGSQNVSAYDNGAYTGEVTANDLKTHNVKYSIIGHSERREYFKENNNDINLKIKKLFSNEITPILCVGETKDERKNNKVKEVIKKEIESAIKDISPDNLEKLIIAYEPIWSIGTGTIPNIKEIEDVFKLIKEILPNSKILYGGSVNENNIIELRKSKIIDGYLLGGLSLKIDKLKLFLNNFN